MKRIIAGAPIKNHLITITKEKKVTVDPEIQENPTPVVTDLPIKEMIREVTVTIIKGEEIKRILLTNREQSKIFLQRDPPLHLR